MSSGSRTEAPPGSPEFPSCIHCGLCLEACPTYALTQNEAESPRGRIHLLAAIESGALAVEATSAATFDHCLGCLACETACPSGVRYRDLLERARHRIARELPRGVRGWLFKRILLDRVMPYPRRLRVAVRAGQVGQALGAVRLLRRFIAVLPPLPSRLVPSPPSVTPAVGTSRGRAGLLAGCAGSAIFPDVNAAAVELLAAAGWEVIVPPAQGCCGALHTHAGNLQRAAAFARVNQEAFASCDLVVTTAAGCGAVMRDDRAHPELAARTRDLSEVLLEAWSEVPPAFADERSCRVAYQDACHLAHAQGVRSAPRRLLEMSGCVLAPAASERCCGAAGTYFLTQPATSRQLLDQKLGELLTEGVECIVTANPGCLLQLRAGAPTVPVEHLATVLRARLRRQDQPELARG